VPGLQGCSFCASGGLARRHRPLMAFFGAREFTVLSAATRDCGIGRYRVMEAFNPVRELGSYIPLPIPARFALWTPEAIAHGAEVVIYFCAAALLPGTDAPGLNLPHR